MPLGKNSESQFAQPKINRGTLNSYKTVVVLIILNYKLLRRVSIRSRIENSHPFVYEELSFPRVIPKA